MKRFLSIFAIMALVVSMFSGVAFAAAGAGDKYTLAATPAFVGQGVDTVINIATTPTDGGDGTIDLADLNGLVVGVYNSAGELQKNASNADITANIVAGAGTAAFTNTDIGDLAAGTYYVKLTSGTDGDSGNGQNQYFDVSNTGFNANEDAEVVVATFDVAPQCQVVLDNNENVNYTSSFGTTVLTGKIIDVETGALRKIDTDVNLLLDGDKDGLYAAGTPLDTVDVTDGTFSMTVETNQFGQFFLYATSTNEAWFDNTNVAPVEADMAYDTFRIVNSVEIATPENLEFDYPVSGQIVVQGVFTNEDFDAENYSETDIELAYIGSYDDMNSLGTPITANFADKESFGFLFDGDELLRVGDIGLYVRGVLVQTGEVKAKELDVTLSPTEIPRALGAQEVVLDFDISSTYMNGDVLKADPAVNNYILRYTIKDGSTVMQSGDLMNGTEANAFNKDVAKQQIKFDVDVDNLTTPFAPGTYNLVVELYRDNTDNDEDTVVLSKEIDLEVVNPSTYSVIGWSLDEANVGDLTIQLPDNTDTTDKIYKNDDEPFFYTINNDQQVSVTKYSGSAYSYPKYVELTVDGCGVDNKTFKNFGDSSVEDDTLHHMLAKITTTETGTLKLTFNVYFDADDSDNVIDPKSTKAFTFTKEVEIKGWNVEVTPNKVQVDSEEDITFTITDEDGNPVNNAVIKIDGVVVVDGTKSNIVGGVYTYEDDDEDRFDNVDKYAVTFHKEAASEPAFVTLSEGMEVLGQEVYTVTTDTPVMINGLEEAVYITVLDEDGNLVYPSFERVNVNSKGEESTGDTPSTSGTRKDLDEDGVKEAVKVTVTPTADQAEMIIRATTDSGKKMGEVRIEVQKPQVVMTGVNSLTENFKQTLKFNVVDPRDNSVLEEATFLQSDLDYVDFSVKTADDGEVNVAAGKSADLVCNDEDVYEYKVFVNDADWDKLEKDEEDAVIELYMELDEDVMVLSIPVAKASLTSDPETLIMGSATNITLTYVDADGNPLEGYDIDLGSDEVGETDENGQVVYATSASTSVSLTFKADTDDSDDNSLITSPHDDNTDTTVTSKKVKAGADVQAPTASYELNGNTAIITITDNVRIAKAMVNGELVDMFFPMPTTSHVVTGLKSGVNTIEVLAGDINNNFAQLTLEITVEATVEPVVFTIGEETTYGTPALKGDTTMVPVRFAQDLGAVVEWDDATQTVTYTLGETTISMTISSKTAVVNGENVQLLEAPYKNDAGRTMVPLRMIAKELGFTVEWTSNSAPISIK